MEATEYKDSPLWQFARYKLAWVYYTLKEPMRAIDTMNEVVRSARDACL